MYLSPKKESQFRDTLCCGDLSNNCIIKREMNWKGLLSNHILVYICITKETQYSKEIFYDVGLYLIIVS